MREIKFRQEKLSGGWHLWGYIDGGFISPLGPNDGGKSYQYTGLKDKNGKEIYEGDILKLKSMYPRDYQERNPQKRNGRIAGPVTFEDGWLFAQPPIKGKTEEDTLLYKGESEQWEVIGDIYNNPELLANKNVA